MGLSRRRVCWGCAGLIVLCTLAAYLRAEAPYETPPTGARHHIPTAVAIDYVEPLDASARAAVAAAAGAVDAVGATHMRVWMFTGVGYLVCEGCF